MERYFSLYPNDEQRAEVLGWMNRDVPVWLSNYDRFNAVSDDICYALNWK